MNRQTSRRRDREFESFKRLIVISDLHCGHRVGLTPPQWQTKPDDDVPDKTKWATIQRETWNWYVRKMKDLNPDILIVNGDAIDGDGPKSKGTELIVASRDEQATMAAECIRVVNAKEIRMTRGTAYHTGAAEDWENLVAEKVGAKIEDKIVLDVNGLIFDFAHHVTGGGSPMGRGNGARRAALWDYIWRSFDKHEHPHVIVRSHLHFYDDSLSPINNQRVFITPGLQGRGSKYGTRICQGVVQVGFLMFDVESERSWRWTPYLMDMQSQAVPIEKL